MRPDLKTVAGQRAARGDQERGRHELEVKCGGCGQPVDPRDERCHACGFPDGAAMLDRGYRRTRAGDDAEKESSFHFAGRAWDLAAQRAHESGDAAGAVEVDARQIADLLEVEAEDGGDPASESFGDSTRGGTPGIYSARYGSVVTFGSGLFGTPGFWMRAYAYLSTGEASDALRGFRHACIDEYAAILISGRRGEITGASRAVEIARDTFAMHPHGGAS